MLRKMYEGKIVPWERHNRSSAKQLEIVRKIASEEEYFEDTLTPDDFKRLQALFNMFSEVSVLNEYDIFSYGFSVGLLLMQDIVDVVKTVLPDDNPA